MSELGGHDNTSSVGFIEFATFDIDEGSEGIDLVLKLNAFGVVLDSESLQ